MNTEVWLPQNFDTEKIWQSLSFGEFFSSWKGTGFVIKLVAAAKVICQHMFFFTLTYFLENNLQNKKKDTIVLVHENHD